MRLEVPPMSNLLHVSFLSKLDSFRLISVLKSGMPACVSSVSAYCQFLATGKPPVCENGMEELELEPDFRDILVDLSRQSSRRGAVTSRFRC